MDTKKIDGGFEKLFLEIVNSNDLLKEKCQNLANLGAAYRDFKPPDYLLGVTSHVS